MPRQDITDRLIRDAIPEVWKVSHDPVVPHRHSPCHLKDQRLRVRIDSRSARIASVLGSIELVGNRFQYQARTVSGLATQVIWAKVFRPSRLPISASVDLCGLESRNRAGN
jgi:hypothetical protein